MTKPNILKMLELSTRKAEQQVQQMGLLIGGALDSYYAGDTKSMITMLKEAESWRYRSPQDIPPLIYSFEKELPERLR